MIDPRLQPTDLSIIDAELLAKVDGMATLYLWCAVAIHGFTCLGYVALKTLMEKGRLRHTQKNVCTKCGAMSGKIMLAPMTKIMALLHERPLKQGTFTEE